MPATPGTTAEHERCTLALQSALTLDEVGSAFMGTAAAVLGADRTGLYRFDGGTSPADVLSDAESDFLANYESYGRDDDPVLEFVVGHRRAIDSTRASDRQRWEASGARAALAEAGLCQSLEAPLIAAGELLGTINFARTDRDRAFATSDLIAARMISEQLSLAIERALRYELAGRRTSALESALDRIPEGVVISDLDSRVIFCNRAAQRIVSGETAARARRVPDEVALAPITTDAALALKSGKRVHSHSIRRNNSAAHLVAKSWLQDDRSGSVVTLVSQGEAPTAAAQPALAVLSAREREIARLVSEGLTSKQIAERAYITENTVKQHLKRIFAKTDVRNRAELVQLIWSSAGR
jgi:DNA-binding CsgD family transcriptional regulator/GAF domain-containing protein